ncbi:MAG: sigma-70 family RNA polymerase sigma factor [Planctomycetota bacterium]|nr:sigma-70 family RNA polymerase sigma factor [Planctomycetota bacterium]
MNDEDVLIQSALAGNSSSFEVLVTRYQDRLYTAMISVVGSADEAEDVVQESFIQAYLKLDTFQQNSRFFTWLYRIAFNYALARRRRNRGHLSLEQGREIAGTDPVSKAESPDNRMSRSEDVQLVHRALAELSEDHRAILVLREMEDMAYEEIAEVLKISIGTVRSRLNRARFALRQQLENFPEWNPNT